MGTAVAGKVVVAVHKFEGERSSPEYLEALRMPFGAESSRESQPYCTMISVGQKKVGGTEGLTYAPGLWPIPGL